MYNKNKNKGVKISLIVAFFAALLGCMIAFVCNPFGVTKEASDEITAPEKSTTSAIAGGETADDGGVYASEISAKATAAPPAAGKTVNSNDGANIAASWTSAINYSLNNNNTIVKFVLKSNWTAAMTQSGQCGFVNTDTTGFESKAISVPYGASIILDLNGYTINRNLGTASLTTTANGHVIGVKGTLYLMDSSGNNSGTITGGNSSTNGAGIVKQTHAAYQVGTLYMYGGTITGNQTTKNGGGIWSDGYSSTYLYGGKITYNTATGSGGGIYAAGPCTLDVGGDVEISHNTTSGSGGGIYADYGLAISGSALISNNSGYSGGGVYSGYNGVMTGGKISNNSSYASGAAVYGDFSMSGGEITQNGSSQHANEASTIFAEQNKHFDMSAGKIYDNKDAYTLTTSTYSTVSFSGSAKVYDKPVKIPNGTTININGKLTSADIMVSPDSQNTKFTSGYSTSGNDTSLVSSYFKCGNFVMGTSGGEAIVTTTTSSTKTSVTWQYRIGTGSWRATEEDVTATYAGQTYEVQALNSSGSTIFITQKYNGSACTTVKKAGSYSFTVDGSKYSNSAFAITITPKEIDISWSEDSMTYTGNKVFPTAKAVGVIEGETVTFTHDSSKAGTNVGSGYKVTASIASGYGEYNQNYVLAKTAQKTQTYSITPLYLSVPTASGSSQFMYDAEEHAYTLSGYNSTYMTMTGTTSATNAGSYTININLKDTTNLSWQTGGTTQKTYNWSINKLPVFVAGIKVADKAYDGTTSATVDMSAVKLIGIIEADKTKLHLEFTAGTEFDSAAIGLRSVAVTGVELTGDAAKNYSLQADEVTGYAQIYPATVTISGVVAYDKTYDGTTAATFNASGASISGAVASELASLKENLVVNGYFANKNVGDDVTVNVTGYVLGGEYAGNYIVDFANSVQSLTANISKAQIEVTLGKTEYKATYGNALKITYTQNNPVKGEGVALDLEYYNADGSEKLSSVPTNAGTYLVKVVVDRTDANSANYSVKTTGEGIVSEATVIIEKATLTVTVEDLEIEYNDVKPSSDDYTLIYSGWLNGDAAIVEPSVTVNSNYVKGDDVGEYELTITASTLANYNIVVADDNGVLLVMPKQVTVKIANKKSAYGAPEVALTSNGTADMGITLEREEGTAVGKYVISGDWDNDNYDITFINGIYEITQATLTVTATADDITYGEAVANTGVVYDGFVNGDDEDALGGELKFQTNYRQFAKVGTYNIAAYGLTSKNYNIEYADGTFEVAPRAVSIVISEDNKSVYGEDLAEIKWMLADGSEEIVNGDKLNVSFTIDYADIANGLPYGEYDVTGTDNDDNYDVTFTTGKYTVTKATLTVITNNATSVYGATPAGNGVTYKGLVDGDESSLTVSLTYLFHNNATDKETVEEFNVGTYAILAQGVSSDNYEVEYEYGVLTVTPAKATVKIDKIEVVYGEEEQELTFKVTGLVPGDDESVLNVTLTRIAGDDAGTYAITGSANADNYTVDIEGSLYVIKPYEITSITWKGQETADASKEFIYTYNGNPQGPTATYTGADGKEHDLLVYGQCAHAGVDFIAEAVLPGARNFTIASSVKNTTQKFTIQAKEVSAVWYFNQGGNKVQVTESTPCKLEYISGIAQAPYAELDGVLGSDTVTVEILGKGISVGNYVARAVIADNTNYVIKVSTSTCDYSITAKAPSGFNWYKATGDSTPAVSGAVSYTFDGLAHQPVVVSGSGDAYSYKITLADGTDCGNVAINAGSYVIIATPVDNDYTITAAQARFEFTITPKVVTISWSGLKVTYNGAVQLPTASYETALDGEQNLTVMCDEETKDADTYTVYVTLPSNYSLADGTTGRIENTFEIEQKVIEVTWTSKLEDGEWKMVYDGTDVADKIEAQASMDSIAEADGVPELLYSISKDGEDGLNEIKDAGEYTVAVSLASSNPNYVVNNSSRTFNIAKKNLQITAESTQATIEYNAPRPNFTADFDGFVDGENAIDLGLLNDSEIVTSAFRWLDTNYSVGKGPAVYEVILTGDEETLKKFYEILKNYDVDFIKGEFEVEAAEGNVWLIGGTHVYDGNGYLPEAYYKAGSDDIQLEVILVAGDFKVDESGKPVNVGTYEITVAKRADDTVHAGVELDKTEWTFEITVRDITVEILDNTFTYGDESTKQSNYGSAVLYSYKDLEPVNGDDIGLEVSVSGITFDAGNYANSGVYSITGSWNKNAEVSANYNVSFVGSDGESGKFTVNKTEITVNNSQNEYDQEAVISGKRIEVTVGKHVEFVGYGDATVTIGYSDVYSLDDYDLTDIPADENGNYSNNKVDLASYGAGKWFVNCKISVPNHEDKYVQWRIIVLPKDQYIQIIFVKEYEVYYGGTLADGSDMPEGNEFAKALYNGGYIDKEYLEGMEENFLNYATARVVTDSVKTAKVGSYSIVIEGLDKIPTTGNKVYAVTYKADLSGEDAAETNVNKFVVLKRNLTIEWGETTFSYDGEKHMPAPVISGWASKQTLTLDDGAKAYVFVDEVTGAEVTVTLSATGDFTTAGQPNLMTVIIDSPNYAIDAEKAACAVSIKPVDDITPAPVKEGGIPGWAIGVIATLAAVTVVMIIAFAVAKGKGKPVSDADGFYDDVDENS